MWPFTGRLSYNSLFCRPSIGARWPRSIQPSGSGCLWSVVAITEDPDMWSHRN